MELYRIDRRPPSVFFVRADWIHPSRDRSNLLHPNHHEISIISNPFIGATPLIQKKNSRFFVLLVEISLLQEEPEAATKKVSKKKEKAAKKAKAAAAAATAAAASKKASKKSSSAANGSAPGSRQAHLNGGGGAGESDPWGAQHAGGEWQTGPIGPQEGEWETVSHKKSRPRKERTAVDDANAIPGGLGL